MAEYEGDVVFREGVHYPIKDDQADLSRPLRRNETNSGWRDAIDGEPLHNDTFHGAEVELLVGGED